MSIKKWITAIGLFFIFFTPIAHTAYAVPTVSGATADKLSTETQILKTIVKKGDSASSLLNNYLPLKTIYKLTRQSADIFPLGQIRAGRTCTFILNQNRLVGFEYEIDRKDRLVIQRNNHTFSITRVPIDYDVSLETVSATIHSSLFEAVRRAGEESRLACKLADIFAWDIDFMRDIRPNDQFRVMVEKKYQKGKFAGYGKIQAALFINGGRRFTAFLHKGQDGRSKYYDEKGDSLEKAFLKAPLAFSRISSKFTLKRMHPILKKIRSHPAVDYAAPIGTPIKTVGDGVVVGMGFSKSMGNHVIIRHCKGYVTRYYHMSKFSKAMKKNRRVLQGEIIGFVGMTGYATGPHLCFRMKKNGRPVNPMSHDIPSAGPVPPMEMEGFLAGAKDLINQMYMTRYSGLRNKTSA